MSSSTWRVLSGYATYQRIPMRMTSWGKWAPLKLIAIVLLPHDGPLVMEGDHTANGLKGKLATKPIVLHVGLPRTREHDGHQVHIVLLLRGIALNIEDELLARRQVRDTPLCLHQCRERGVVDVAE